MNWTRGSFNQDILPAYTWTEQEVHSTNTSHQHIPIYLFTGLWEIKFKSLLLEAKAILDEGQGQPKQVSPVYTRLHLQWVGATVLV